MHELGMASRFVNWRWRNRHKLVPFILESWWNMKEEALQDVVERLVRIETKLDNYESLREKADSAKDLADKAYSVALNNAEDIKEMKNNNKWAWGYMIGLGITIIGYFLTKL